MYEFAEEHEQKVNERKQVKGLTGAKGCSVELNKMTGGFQDEDYIVLAARPSMGKSAMVLNDACSIADDYLDRGVNGAVALFSLEMGALSMLERVICIIGGLEADKLKTGDMSPEDWIKYRMAVYRLTKMNFYIDESPGQSIQYIEQQVKELKKKHDKLTVIIDFLQLVEIDGSNLEGHAKIGYISKRCKRIARRYKCPVIAISAVGRGVEQRQDKRPMMSDLRESGSIESDADIIVFIYRDDYYDKESAKKAIVELIVAKGRNIGTGTIEMAYIKNTNRFLNLDRSHHERAQKEAAK
jgi:replicative DNA helicase